MPLPNNDTSARRQMAKRLYFAGLAALAVAVLVIANGTWLRLQAKGEETSASIEQSIPTVGVVHPTADTEGDDLVLPGRLEAYSTAHIYPRVPGYIREWYKDIGAPVHRGDFLALVDTPELDQQISQAKANLASAKAAQKLSQSTSERWKHLLAISAVSKQDADEKAADYEAKSALVNAANANVVQLQSMKGFAKITAPFDGVVTERTTDIGSLVNAGGPGSSGTTLFTVSDVHKMRVYVRVPQNYTAQIRNGMTAELTLPEYPDKTFTAKLVSTSNAISDQSNSLLVQLEADNKNGDLKPGAYAQVSLKLPPARGQYSIPVSALMFRGDGLQVATLGAGNRVAMKPIRIAQDLGSRVVVSAGLDASDNVIDNPPDSLRDGDEVRLAAPVAAQRAENR